MRRNSDNSSWMRVISIGILLQILANCGKSQFFPTFNFNPFIIGRSSSRRVTRSATAIYSEHCSTRSNSFQFYLILRQVICVVTIFGLIQWYGLNAVRISSSGRIIILKLFVFFFLFFSGHRWTDEWQFWAYYAPSAAVLCYANGYRIFSELLHGGPRRKRQHENYYSPDNVYFIYECMERRDFARYTSVLGTDVVFSMFFSCAAGRGGQRRTKQRRQQQIKPGSDVFYSNCVLWIRIMLKINMFLYGE